MTVLMGRWALPISFPLLLTLTACDGWFEFTQISDAELFCRQGGYGLGSTAYDDCVETSIVMAARAAPPETASAAQNGSEAVPLVTDAGAAEAEPGSPSEPIGEPGEAPKFLSDPPDQPSFAIHLTSVRSQTDTGPEWKRLQQLYPDLLEDGDLMVRPVDLEEQGVYFRVLAGPFTNYARARGVCAKFKSRDQYCLAMRIKDDQADLLASAE